VIREAVTNVGRHAGATEASVRLGVDDGLCRLQVTDNGCGIEMSGNNGGFGLPNLQRRAEKLHGTFTIDSLPTGGTSLTWKVPLAQ
jgi:signal transduction histidine kinase